MQKPLSLIVIAAIALTGAQAGAQVTTVITPPPKVERAAIVAAERKVQSQNDSVSRVAMTNMKAWVDSAATALATAAGDQPVPTGSAVAATPPATDSVRRDSAAASPLAPAPRPAEPAPTATAGQDTAVVAPDTATAAPTLALAGATLVLAGVTLLRRRRA